MCSRNCTAFCKTSLNGRFCHNYSHCITQKSINLFLSILGKTNWNIDINFVVFKQKTNQKINLKTYA